jgi:hypothetical protein
MVELLEETRVKRTLLAALFLIAKILKIENEVILELFNRKT